MSRESAPVGLAIEWSPRGVVAYDANTRKTTTAEDLPSLNLGSRDAVLALSRRGVFVRTTRVPNNADAGAVRNVLLFRAGELFPLPPIDLAWDFTLTDDVNEDGRLAVLAAVPCADLRRALDAAAAAGLRLRAAIPLAVGATILAAEMGLAEAAVVECADDGPAVDIVSGGALRASRATPTTVPLQMEVTRALGLAGLDAAPVVAAGGSNLDHAAHHTERTALMALADAPFDRLKMRLELPEAVAARTTAASRRQIRTASLAAVGAALVAVYALMQYLDTRDAAEINASRAKASLTKLQSATKKAGAERDRWEGMGKALDLAFSPAQKPSEVVALATTSVPPGAWLKGITFERGRPMTLRGTAKSPDAVADLLKRLDARPDKRFRAVVPSNVNNDLLDKTPVTEFVVSAFPVGNLPFLARANAGR